jgi:four helix bundle protein
MAASFQFSMVGRQSIQCNNPASMSNHRDLAVWHKSIDLAEAAHIAARGFPRYEQFSLGRQFRDAASSVPANIAEGCGRGTTKELIRFLDIARGSLHEFESHLELARRLGYIEDPQPFESSSREIGRMINGLKKALHKRQEGESPSPSDH